MSQEKKGILGKKVGMTQLFGKAGELLPVTVIDVTGCCVVQKKSREKEGYEAVQLGFQEISEKRASKPLKGHFKKHGLSVMRYLREFPAGFGEGLKEGDSIKSDIFKEGDLIAVTGVTKGKGFQGVIKRHGKSGGPASHGSRFHRTTGSIGQRTSPGEVFKNMKLPGHLGDETVTVKNLQVVEVRENLLFLKGAVPGANNNLVMLRKVAS
ncbi:MAG: 50S ribosomal protein L3 [Deltaproteobacteria bacterium]|nr:50S ribosomal protein L3 [Deltaproteobacteria bacterium]